MRAVKTLLLNWHSSPSQKTGVCYFTATQFQVIVQLKNNFVGNYPISSTHEKFLFSRCIIRPILPIAKIKLSKQLQRPLRKRIIVIDRPLLLDRRYYVYNNSYDLMRFSGGEEGREGGETYQE